MAFAAYVPEWGTAAAESALATRRRCIPVHQKTTNPVVSSRRRAQTTRWALGTLYFDLSLTPSGCVHQLSQAWQPQIIIAPLHLNLGLQPGG